MSRSTCYWVQSQFAETRFVETLIGTLTRNLTLNPNFGESGFGESGRHPVLSGMAPAAYLVADYQLV